MVMRNFLYIEQLLLAVYKPNVRKVMFSFDWYNLIQNMILSKILSDHQEKILVFPMPKPN